MDDLLTIGEVAERSGLAASAIRFYERQRTCPCRTGTRAGSDDSAATCSGGSPSSGSPSGWG